MAPSLLLPLLLQAASPPAGAAPQTINWTETTGIQWCSDGKSPDWAGYPKDPFGAGLDGVCPHTPASWSLDRVVQECEKLCAPADPCLGFTLYPSAHQGGRASRNLTECCFRTGGVGQKPKCTDAACQGTRCCARWPPPPPPRAAAPQTEAPHPHAHTRPPSLPI